MNTRRYWIGLDDTDADESIGTGALARELMTRIRRVLKAQPEGITRHQLLIHPDIPYTSHNSAACLQLTALTDPADLLQHVCEFVEFLFHEGADPAVVICDEGFLGSAMYEFGRRAQREVLEPTEAIDICKRSGAYWRVCGGENVGIVGATAACGLRMSRCDGRFISFEGMRSIQGTIKVGRLLQETPIQCVIDEQGKIVTDSVLLDTRDWVRPEWREKTLILRVRRTEPGKVEVVKEKKMDQH